MPDAPFTQTVELGPATLDRLEVMFSRMADEIASRLEGEQEVRISGIGAGPFLDLVQIIKRALAEREG